MRIPDRAALVASLRQHPWRAAFTLVGGFFVFLIAGLVIWVAAIYPQLPSLDRVTDYQPQQPLQVFTQDGVEIAQFGAEKRVFLPIEKIPKMMQDAVISVEDARFREHSGVDPVGIARAMLANITPGGMRQGASTITQQVARNFFLSSKRTLDRKVREALLAIKMEKQLDKDHILELYMNQIYLGHRAYGFGAAAEVYFGKSLDQLSIAQYAMLAGLPQNPGYANPITNLDRATARQHVVLGRMLATGVITQSQYDEAIAQKIVVHSEMDVPVHAEFVAEMARQAVYQQFGDRAYTEGFKVYTSLRSVDQETAYAALRRSIIDHERRQAWRGPEDQEDLGNDTSDDADQATEALSNYRDDEDLRVAIVINANPKKVVVRLATGEEEVITGEGLRSALAGLSPNAKDGLALRRGAIIRVIDTGPKTGWAITQWPRAEGAFVSLDPATGRIRALVGGFDFTRKQFNHVTQAWRQPGSSFKPFLYSAAMEHGVQPATVVNDAPWQVGADGWNPQNDDGRFDGPMSLRRALAKSKNLVSIRLVQYIGVDAARQWAARFGFDPARQPNNLTLALGAGTTTPMQMVSAYAAFANGGYKVDPVVIERIEDARGTVIYQAPPPAKLDESRRVIPARNAFILDSLLNEVTRSGTAARAQAALRRPDLYGKTGTTNDVFDAWFAGFQPSVVAVAWVGYDDPHSLGPHESGSRLALPVWISYMERVLKDVPVHTVTPPDGVQDVNGEWYYNEYAEGGNFVTAIGLDDAADAASAASAPASDAVPAATGLPGGTAGPSPSPAPLAASAP